MELDISMGNLKDVQVISIIIVIRWPARMHHDDDDVDDDER